MSEPQPIEEPSPGAEEGDREKDAAAGQAAKSALAPAPAGTAALPKALTAEEQMALYEEKLKEEDWGHQPC